MQIFGLFSSSLITCPECGNEVSSAAASCPKCGNPIQAQGKAPVAAVPLWSPGIAALLSLVIPGAGQMYKGQVVNGLVWFIFVAIGYAAFVVPGLVLHLFCIIGAASGNPMRQYSSVSLER